MKTNALLGLALVVSLVPGCGSSDQVAATDLGTPPQADLRGRVLSEGGQAQPGVRVVVHERTTNLKAETISGGDGSFQLSLPMGVYDLGLDRPGDTQTATCFYGPVTVAGQANQDFILRSSQGRPAQHVSGRLWRQPQAPASNRLVHLRTGHLPGRLPDGTRPPERVSTTTAADGTFELLLSSERELGLDLEVHDELGRFDEFIDIGKLAKPAYVEFMTDGPAPANQHRSDQSELRIEADKANAPVPTDFSPYSQFWAGDQYSSPTWSQGLIPVSSHTYNFFDDIETDAVSEQVYDQLGQLENIFPPSGQLRVDKNGSWFWTYAVNLKSGGTGWYTFTDQTSDTYNLTIIEGVITYTHKVSYNSAKPALQSMGWANF